MKIATLHLELLQSVLDAPLTEQAALLWMTLLHTHAIKLRAPIVIDVPNTTFFHALTQREAATVVATLWPDQADQRAGYMYWYFLWNTTIHCELMEELPPDIHAAICQLLDRLAQEPRIAAIIDEDREKRANNTTARQACSEHSS